MKNSSRGLFFSESILQLFAHLNKLMNSKHYVDVDGGIKRGLENALSINSNPLECT